MHEETERAISAVDANANEQWKALALEAVRWAALNNQKFTTDAPWKRLDETTTVKTHDNRALGPVVRRAARLGYIEKTKEFPEFLPSERANLHDTPLQVWCSKIYQS